MTPPRDRAMSPIVIVPVIESEEKIKVNIVGRKYLIIVRVVTINMCICTLHLIRF
jgi:hypothetical protein